MNDADLFHRFVLASSVAAGAGVAGVGMLLFAPKGWLGRAVLGAVAVAVTSGLVGLLAADFLPWVAGGGAVAAVLAVVAGSPAVRRAVGVCVRPLARVRVLGVAAVLAAFGVWGYEAWRFDTTTDGRMDESMARMATETTPLDVQVAATAVTDRGAKVDLNSPTAPVPADQLAAAEKTGTVLTAHTGKVIRRGAPTDESNCHGWVFTGGRYNLGGRFVETILADNGYARVSTPAAGDVCVYRGDDAAVSHTGVVRGVLDDGTVMVESKWGRLGVYLHAAGDSCYGTDFTFHRTARGTHLLGGIEGTSDATAASPAP